MDLTAASVSAYQQTQIQSQAQFSVAAKVLNIAQQEGTAAIQLLQSATQFGGGDSLTTSATGLGGSLDTYA
jgi:hypothetical protein